jgi:DNA invertase Pin-like site-specific DNA recombinase
MAIVGYARVSTNGQDYQGQVAEEAIQRLANGESQAHLARAYNVDPAAICRLAAAGTFQ